MKKLITILLIGLVSVSFSQTTLLFQDLDNGSSGWTYASNSGNDWGVYNSADARSGNGVAIYQYSSSEAADSYLFFQALYLEAGYTYDVDFWQKVASSTYPEKFELTVGTSNTIASQTTSLNDWGAQTNESYTNRTASYTPSTSGIYYFAVHCYSDADEWNLFVDDITVQTNGSCKDHSCTAATNIASLPYSNTDLTTCGNCNNYSSADACGSVFMDGPEYVFTYTPSSDGWVDVQLTTTVSGLRNGGAVFLTDNCPSSGANCLASSTVQFPANHGDPHIIYDMTAGQTYYIIVSNDPYTTSSTNSCLYFDIDVSNISQPNPTEEDCFGSQPICGSSITESNPGNGPGAYPSEINSTTSCLEGERNGKWYSFNVEASGTITVDIQPDQDGVDADGYGYDDYDFALYNVTNAGCEGIFDGSSPQVACNYAMVDGGSDTGVNSATDSENDYESTITVNAGETYMLYVSQWSVSTSGYTITLGGGADYIDNSGPELASVDQPNCAQNEVVVHFTEAIDCSSYVADGSDFTFSNPGGSSLTITGASSAICDAGGAFTDEIILTLSGNITVAGTYTVGLNAGTISDQCGHATTGNSANNQSFTIVTPTVTAGSNSAICQNQTLSLTETGGDANTWSWTGPNSFTSSTQNPNISNAQVAADGIYTVVGTISSTGCSNSDNVDVTVNALPTVTPTSNSPICDGETLSLNETGGASGASWIWTSSTTWNPADIQNPSQTNASTALSGTYTVSVTDGNNCSNSASTTVTVNSLPAVNPVTNAPICEGENLTLNETGGDATSWTWNGDGSWNPADVQNPNQASALVSSTGTYTVTVSDGTCTNTGTVSVTVNDAAEVNAGANDVICANQTYTLSGSYGGGASSVLWTTSGDGTFSDATSATATYTPGTNDIPAVGAAANNITLTLTTNDPAGPCNAVSDNMVLTINPMEDASFSYSSGSYCSTASDPTPTITGVSGGTFSASAGITINSSTGQLDVSSGTVGQTYTITYTTPGTCSNSSSVSVTINSGADAEFSYTTPICSSSSDPLPSHSTGSDGSYSSTAGLVFVNTSTGEIDLSASTPGTYTVTNYVDLGSCGNDTKTFDIEIQQAAEVSAGSDNTVCESDLSYALSGATQGGSTSSITWSGGAGSFANANNINTNYVFGAGETGAVTLTVTTNDPAGVCPAVSDNIVLTIDDAAEVNAGADDAICADATYTLSGTSGGSTANITWTTSGDGSFSDNTSLTAVYTPGSNDKTNGSVTLTISSDDPSGPCGVVTDDMVLTINPLPTVVAGSNSPVCQGTTLNLTESGGNATAWVWTGGYNPADVQNPSQSNIQVSATANYTVTGTITATGCSAQDVVSVTVNPTPSVTAGSNSPICENEQLNLTETGGDADAWTWTSTTSYDPDDIQNPIHTNSMPSESGNYTVVGQITATGCSASDVVAVTINALPTVVANADDNTVCEGTAVTLTGSGANSYSWDNGVTDGSAFVPGLGTTTYSVTGTDGNSCTNTDQIDVIVSPQATANAGANDAICENETYTLNGSIGGGASSATWTTSGDGSFDDATNLAAIYTPGATDPGTTVTFTLTTDDPASDCGPASDQMQLTIHQMDDASFSYSGGTYCSTASDPTPTITGLSGGTFSAIPVGLVINASTGVIDVSASTIGGPYTVTYTTNGTCPNLSTFDINISSGADAEFSYTTPICSSDINPQPTHTTGSNGVYSSTAGLVFVNTGTGEIDLSASTAGTYTVTNTVDLGTCGSDTHTFSITIDEAAEVFAGNDNTVCESDVTYTISDATTGGSTTQLTWTTSGDGTFNNNNATNPIYTFGSTEIGTSVWLTATTNDPATSCGVVKDSMLLTINQAPTVNAGIDDSICAGETYMMSGSLGGATSSIAWSTNGDGIFDDEHQLTATYTPGVTDLTNGTVTLTITSNSNGVCSAVSDDMILRIDPLPSVVAGVVSSPLCVGDQLDLTETGGEADTWVWIGTGSYDPDDVQNPSLASVYTAAAGTYTVTGTITATGCLASDVVDVVVNPVPTVNAGVIANPVCANESVDLTETGGEATSWSWSAANGYSSTDQNPTIANATADTSGMYFVVGTIGATGCSSIDSVDITVNPLPIVSYTVDANDTICFGEPVTLTGTGNATSYTWNNSVNNGIAFTPNSTNTYTVLGEDANGCKDSVDVQVVVNPLPNIFAGNDQTVPYNGTTTINDATPTGLNYSWTPADSLVDASVLNPTTVPLHIFNEFILEGTDPITGCSNMDTMNITVVGGPLSIQLFANPNDTICSGDAHYVYAIPSGGVGDAENFTYTWDDGNSGVYPNNDTLLLDTVLTTKTYSVTVTDEGVGVISASITVVVNDLPNIVSIDSSDVLCYGDATGTLLVNATGDAPLSYSINGGTTYVNDSSFVGLSQGTYDVLVQSNYGCTTNFGLVNISQPIVALQVNDTLSVDASCGNNNGTLAVEVSGGTTPYTYSWSNADTTNMTDSLYAGTYDLTVVDNNGCQSLNTYSIANAGGGHLVIQDVTDVNCYGDSTGVLTVKMTEGFPTFDFYISLAGNPIDSLISSNDSIYSVNMLPSNTYQLIAHEGAGCISTIDVTIGTNSEIVIQSQIIGSTCYQSNDGQISIDVSGGTNPYTYNWSGPDSYSSNLEDIILLKPGLYNLTVSDNLGCDKTLDNVQVTEPNEPGVTLLVQNQEQCYGFSEGVITSVGNGGTVPYTYKWTNGTWVDNNNEIDSLPAGDYHLLISDANNCDIADTIVTISEYARMILKDSTVYKGIVAEISMVKPGDLPRYTYTWTDKDGKEVSSDYKADDLITGSYMVNVLDEFYGCEVSDTFNIEIPFVIPTLITPNNDGYNDYWKLGDIESYDDIFIEIYNRWGNVVYTYSGSGYGYLDQPFDGTFNGSDLPIGAYVYILDLKNGKEPSHGIVNIVRTK